MCDREFTVLSRQWCHLCHDFIAALAPIAEEYGWSVKVLDIDEFPELEQKWDEDVPVLLHADRHLCCHRLDAEAVRVYCRSFR